ncbi:MAG TPA: hypothetical protein VLC98_09650 [Phnomibacter sp.]|nr:hypothetical protein [Phnomibacter sp.]
MAKILWMGFRFDARYVAFVSLVTLLLGFFPGLHLFRSRAGKRFGITLYTVFAAILLLVYGFDFASQITFNTRIDGALITELLSNSGRAPKLFANTPWIIILLLTGVGTWLLYMLIRFLHKLVSNTKSTDNKAMRIFWQVLVTLGFAIIIYGSIGGPSLSYKTALLLENKNAAKMAINAFEALRHPF